MTGTITHMLRLALVGAGLSLLAACATPTGPEELVVLLPDSKGKVGEVVVDSGGNKAVLNSALAAARVSGGKTAPETETLQQKVVDKTFARALDAVPPEPVSFTLYFAKGSTDLLPKSEPAMRLLILEVASRQIAEVQVTGHTDRVGRVKTNDELALKRAKAVAETLRAKNLGTKRILTAGRGEREPLVPTKDGVAEPLNRRVEIIVR